MKRIVLLRRRFILIILLLITLVAVSSIYFINISKDSSILDTTGLTHIHLFNSEYKHFIYTFEGKELEQIKNNRFTYSKTELKHSLPTYDNYSFVFVYEDEVSITIRYQKTLDIFYKEDGCELSIPYKLKNQMKNFMGIMDNAIYNTYGELMPWEEVKLIFSLMSYARIIDFETGISFMVQRRAGSKHADAQPVTKEDTTKMKKILGGEWSWDRRAIIVEIENYRIAASMNGMPHGSGRISDNNFDGHFCIHFLNSSTHSGNIDPDHLKQVLRAAGKLP